MIEKIIGLFLIIIIIFIIYAKNTNVSVSKESWENVKLNSYSPIYSNNQKQDFNPDNSNLKKTSYEDGYKLENGKTQCLYQCKTVKSCKPSMTPSTTSDPNKINSMGYRINYYPWFIPNTN